MSDTTGNPAKLITGYWNIRGLAAPVRMMCHYAKHSGQKFDWADKQYDLPRRKEGGFDMTACEWFRDDKQPLSSQNALINLPYVVDHAFSPPLVVTQSTAVYQYLGRKFNMLRLIPNSCRPSRSSKKIGSD